MNAKHLSLLAIIFAACVAIPLTGCHTPTATMNSSATPCMAVLARFTAADVPAMGPAEIESPAGKWTNAVTPAGLPGNGLAQHPMLYVGENYTKMFLVNDGKVIWTYQTGPGYEYDDVWMLSNGNILFTRMQYVAEITPDKKVVWRYDCDNSSGTNHTEVHTCQPIGLDKVMFVLNGLPPRLMVVNIKTGAVEVNHEVLSPTASRSIPRTFTASFAARVTPRRELISFPTLAKARSWNTTRILTKSGDIRSARRGPPSVSRTATRSSPMSRTASRAKSIPKARRSGNSTRPICRKPISFAQAPQTCTRLANGNTIFCFARRQRQRPATRRSHPGQKSRLGAARLARPR